MWKMKPLLGAALIGLATASTAQAHPHVWLEARAELIFDDQNRFLEVRHVWQFDEGFSAFATQGLDENKDGKLSREELAELAEINVDSLSDFEYFTFVQMGEEDPPYNKPKDYWLKHEEGVLTLHFTLPMKEPIAPDKEKGFQDLTVEVFDATFFVDVAFMEENPVKVSTLAGKPSVCTASLQRRKGVDVIQSQLLSQIGPDEQIPEDLTPQEGELSNTIRITCPTS